MGRTIGIGIQSFDKIRERNSFYIDKTGFIREWWESGDDVTLITRPRRFGKTLNMSMVQEFFSIEYAHRADLFENLDIWKDEKYRRLQGTYPVISLSFAGVKEKDYQNARKKICQLLTKLYAENAFLFESNLLYETDKAYFRRVCENMDDSDASLALSQLCDFLKRYYEKNVIILLDEYDTPMQEAYVNGYCDELVAFTRNIFNSAFKSNPYMERAIMTGITRVSKESIFSDLNNLKVVTTTSDEYATSFGFTQEEVISALDECGYGDMQEQVRAWYDGFVFGQHRDIYNPWSILNFLDTGKIGTYWANTSSNSLIGKLLKEGSSSIKTSFEQLLKGKSIQCPIDEQIVYEQLTFNEDAIWSLLLASGYLKVLQYEPMEMTENDPVYELAITNMEVRRMFRGMVQGWFKSIKTEYNSFIEALLKGDLDTTNAYMNRIVLQIFSYFDTANDLLGEQPERFYHGFVLGLIVELDEEYIISSNRESGFGRYDVALEPKDKTKNAVIIEFRVFNPGKEKTLEDTVRTALEQIEEKKYETALTARGIPKEQIYKYGFAFEGKNVLIG